MAKSRRHTAFKFPGVDELLRLLVDEVRDYAIIVMDPKNRVQMWNRGAREMLGFTAKEMSGKSARVIFTPEDRAAKVPEKEMAAARRDGRAEDERWHLRKNGQRFWGSGVMTALHGDDGSIIAYVKLLRDHTERKKLEDQTQAINELLEQRVSERTTELVSQQERLRSLALETTNAEQRARDAIAADLHDNLAQIMAVSLMKLGAAGTEFPGGKPPPKFLEAVECVRETLRLTRNMMYDLSPMMVGKGQLRSAIEWVAERMKRHGLEIKIQDRSRARQMSEDMLRVVYRAVQELLWNVVKHAQANRATVTISTHRGMLRVTVQDRGRGFNPNRISRASESGGFGLFSLRERLSALGGTMKIKSARGKGTEVTLEAPLQN
jgi:PAS domain S-box-containing protein